MTSAESSAQRSGGTQLKQLLMRVPQSRADPSLESPSTAYVGLADIVGHGAGTAQPRLLGSVQDAGSLKHRFQTGDILYGQLRPELNKVWLADRNGLCSTDCLVLRSREPDSERTQYIAHFLRSQPAADAAAQLQRGTSLPRVGWRELETFAVHVPEKDELHRRIQALGQIDALRSQSLSESVALETLGHALIDTYLGRLDSDGASSRRFPLSDIVTRVAPVSLPSSARTTLPSFTVKQFAAAEKLEPIAALAEEAAAEVASTPARRQQLRLYLSGSAEIFPVEFLVAYLNSSEARRWLQSECAIIKGRLHLPWNTLSRIPIPSLNAGASAKWSALFTHLKNAQSLVERREALAHELRLFLDGLWFGLDAKANTFGLVPLRSRNRAPYRNRPVYEFLSPEQKKVLTAAYGRTGSVFSLQELQALLGGARSKNQPVEIHREHLRGILEVFVTLGLLVPVEDDVRIQRWRPFVDSDLPVEADVPAPEGLS